MGNALTTFQTPAFGPYGNTFHIRVVDIGGEPWFVAADVCHALGLHFGDGGGTVKQHCRNISDDEMMLIPKSKVTSDHPRAYPNRGANCVSESALYKLILRSDKPQAKPFQDWVTRVVLPAIRKDGGYIQGEEKVAKGELLKDTHDGRLVEWKISPAIREASLWLTRATWIGL